MPCSSMTIMASGTVAKLIEEAGDYDLVGGIAGMTELVNSPTYSTGVGLVIYGAPYAEAAAARRASPAGGGVIERVKRFFADFI